MSTHSSFKDAEGLRIAPRVGREMNKLGAYIQLARPHLYLKNGIILAPLFFGYKLNDPQAVLLALHALVAFCLAGSIIYVFNDIRDVEADRQHPVKKFRPLASGALRKSEATLFLTVLLVLLLSVSLTFTDKNVPLLLGIYLLLNVAYSWSLQHLAIIDVVCIATGLVLRIFAGGVAAGVWPSHWLVLTCFFLGLFVALAQRRHDLLLAALGQKTRRCLDHYSLEFVSLSMVLMGAAVLISYILYTVSLGGGQGQATSNLYLTTFWVTIGLLRFIQDAVVDQKVGVPIVILLKDFFLQAVILLWLGSCYLMLYVFNH